MLNNFIEIVLLLAIAVFLVIFPGCGKDKVKAETHVDKPLPVATRKRPRIELGKREFSYYLSSYGFQVRYASHLVLVKKETPPGTLPGFTLDNSASLPQEESVSRLDFQVEKASWQTAAERETLLAQKYPERKFQPFLGGVFSEVQKAERTEGLYFVPLDGGYTLTIKMDAGVQGAHDILEVLSALEKPSAVSH